MNLSNNKKMIYKMLKIFMTIIIQNNINNLEFI